MPEISSATPLLAAAPAAPAQVAPAGPTAGAGPDVVAQDFLGQLKAALKSLAGVVTPQPTALQAAPTAAPPAVADPLTATGAAPLDTRPADKPADAVLPEILAVLGFVTVPQPPAPQPAAVAVTSDAKGAVVSPPTSTVTAAPLIAATAQQPSAPSEKQPQPPTQPTDLQLPKEAQVTAQVETPTAQTPAPTTGVSDAAPVVSAPVLQQDQQQPVAITPQVTVPHVQQPATSNSFQQGQGSRDGDKQSHTSPVASPLTDVTESTSTPAPAPTSAVVDQTLASATAASVATASTNQAQPTTQVHPGEVVSQIAHQADLYRLPGNKGVRINLHPDDLGGVQVSLRYAAGGSLELHINVEHATTGALVEAGWTQLRDALATQGIGPDRLVMSVTGPSGSTQLDFSSNGNGSNRPDAGLAAFTQGGDSDQRQDNNGDGQNTRGPRGWSSSSDSTATGPDDRSRTANVASASRIDYRV